MINTIRLKETGEEFSLGAGGSKLYRHAVKLLDNYDYKHMYMSFVSTKDTPYQSLREICEYLNGSFVMGDVYKDGIIADPEGTAKIEFTYTNENNYHARAKVLTIEWDEENSTSYFEDIVLDKVFDDYLSDEDYKEYNYSEIQDTVTEV